MKNLITLNNITLDVDTRCIIVDGKSIRAEKKVFELAYLLMNNAGKIISREQIESHIWRETKYVDNRTINACVSKLRKVIGNDSIETYVGVGYKFVTNKKLFCEKYNDNITKLENISRVEVIDKGRAYVNNSCSVELSIQDDGRTMKLFIS